MKSIWKILFFYSIIFGLEASSSSSDSPRLIVNNNSPVTLGSNITFSAVLEQYPSGETLYYTFNDTIQVTEISANYSNVSISRAFTSDLYGEGIYNMTVHVRKEEFVFLIKEIASNYSSFSLKDGLVGKLLVYRENEDTDVDEVAIGENVTMIIDIYDPSGYLAKLQFDYIWSIDWETEFTQTNSFIHNYSRPMTSNVEVGVVATSPGIFLESSFSRILKVKVPVNKVNISGNPFLHHGEILNLNVSCNGSSPFEYCWRPLKVNETEINLTCHQPIVSTTCNFHITRYFQNYGTYHVGIYVSNDVKVVKRIIEVMVYNVSTKPTLSTVIIPIICSLLTLVIIAGGIAYCIQQRNQLAVEVANFDFQEESGSYSERTFFEQIFDSVMCRNCGRNQFVSGDGESAEDENYPILCDPTLERV